MCGLIKIGGLNIKRVYTEREINFVVSDNQGYLFKLVPDIASFRLSLLDQALGIKANPSIVEKIGSRIDSYFF